MTDDAKLVVHRESPGNERAIVFVHGFGGKAESTWGEFPRFAGDGPGLAGYDVYSLGYTTSMAPDIRGGWRDIPRIDSIAQGLATRLEFDTRLSRYTGEGSVALVAHSMGGLVAQRAMLNARDEVHERVGHLVMFGTPSGGLKVARFLRWLNRQVGDMAVGGPFVTSLREAWTDRYGDEPPFQFRAGAGDEDAFVPASSSIDPFATPLRFVVPGDHLSIVKPLAADSLSVAVVLRLLAGELHDDEMNTARVALESKDFATAVAIFEPRRAQLAERDAINLAMALEGMGRRDDAMAVLHGLPGTDARGVMAGRLKRRWWAEEDPADADQALELYRGAYEEAAAKSDHPQGFYHAINVAYLEAAHHDDRAAAAEWARKAAGHAEQAATDYWSLATQAEARLYVDDPQGALLGYRAAVGFGAPPRQLESTYVQASWAAGLLYGDEYQDDLDEIFGIEAGEPA